MICWRKQNIKVQSKVQLKLSLLITDNNTEKEKLQKRKKQNPKK